MFALSHTYVSTQVLGRATDLLVFGSVLPDIAWSSKSEIGKDKIHYAPQEFFDFVAARFPTLLDLAIGVKLHSNSGKGADFYSDDAAKGYAKIEGKKIQPDVALLLNSEMDDTSLILAHNFIEAGIDLNLQKFQPEVMLLYRKSLHTVNRAQVIECLHAYLKVDTHILKEEINHFTHFLSSENLSTPEYMVQNIFMPLIKVRIGKNPEKDGAIKIVKKAQHLTRRTYFNFLNNTIASMKKDFIDVL